MSGPIPTKYKKSTCCESKRNKQMRGKEGLKAQRVPGSQPEAPEAPSSYFLKHLCFPFID